MKVEPIRLRDEDGKEYVLEFTRASVRYAEDHGFNIKEFDAKIFKTTTDLFHYAFRANHPNLTHQQTDDILFDKLGGMTKELVDRLVRLFSEPYAALVAEDLKNAKWTVTM